MRLLSLPRHLHPQATFGAAQTAQFSQFLLNNAAPFVRDMLRQEDAECALVGTTLDRVSLSLPLFFPTPKHLTA